MGVQEITVTEFLLYSSTQWLRVLFIASLFYRETTPTVFNCILSEIRRVCLNWNIMMFLVLYQRVSQAIDCG